MGKKCLKHGHNKSKLHAMSQLKIDSTPETFPPLKDLAYLL